MTSKRWLRKRLVHTCTIQRDNGTGQSDTGMVGTAWVDVGTSVLCRYYEQNENVADEDLGRVTIKMRHLLLDASQNVAVNDRINNVCDSDGSVIEDSNLLVERLITPRGITGETYYRKALLSLPETT